MARAIHNSLTLKKQSMKSFKLDFDEKVEERLGEVEMKNITGGMQVEYYGSMLLCETIEPGDCARSKSCDSEVWICIPVSTPVVIKI